MDEVSSERVNPRRELRSLGRDSSYILRRQIEETYRWCRQDNKREGQLVTRFARDYSCRQLSYNLD